MAFQAKTPFDHKGKEYEVRALSDGTVIHVRAHTQDGTPANGWEYSVTEEIQSDARTVSSSIDPVDVLIRHAMDDVKSGLWEQYLSAVKAGARK